MTIGNVQKFIDSNAEAFLFRFDLKSCYYHVDMNIDSQKYQGFSWVFKDSSERFFQIYHLVSHQLFSYLQKLGEICCWLKMFSNRKESVLKLFWIKDDVYVTLPTGSGKSLTHQALFPFLMENIFLKRRN